MEKNSRVLLIAQAFPPVAGSHTERVVAFIQQFKTLLNVHGITLEVGSGYPQKDVGVEINIPITRTFPGVLHHFVHGNPRTINSPSDFAAKKSVISSVISHVSRFVFHIIRKIEVIDSYVDWMPHLVLGIKKELRDEDFIISTSMPNTTHVSVLLSLHGRKNKWLVDFGDPWTLNKSLVRSGFRSRLEGYLERKIISRATLVSFTTENTLRDYQDFYKEYAEKMLVIRMGFNSEDTVTETTTLERKTVFYGGSLPKENRNAEEFLKMIISMDDVDFIFAGTCAMEVREYYNDEIPSNVILIDWLDHKKYIQYLKSSSLSVIFGNANYQQVPGKVYQNLAFAKKILYIAEMDVAIDESLKILNGDCYISYNDMTSIKVRLIEALNGEDRSNFNIKKYSWDEVMRDAKDLIYKICVGL